MLCGVLSVERIDPKGAWMSEPQNEYRVRLRSTAEREAKIGASVEASKEQRDFYDFRNQLIKLPLVRVPEDFLVYRMENFRTYVDQHRYLVRERKAENYFSTGQESEEVQQLQHQFLARLARKGRSDSVTPVITVLRQDKQREPLIVTHRGVVVNGNRRLAAMRELSVEDRAEFADFAYIDCLVLPSDATPSEIVDIEAALQAKPETRLDYDWVGDAQLIQRLLNLGRSVDQVASRLNRKPAEVSNAIAALLEADLYLKDWKRAGGQYDLVIEAEQLFKDLPGLIENKPPSQADASRAVAWNLLENKDRLGARVYSFNAVIGKSAERVLSHVAEAMNLPVATEEADSDEETFDIDIPADAPPRNFAPVLDALRNPRTKEEAAEALVEVSRDIIEEERTKKGANAALKAIASAYAKLIDVNLGAAESRTYDDIEIKLNQIVERATGLKSILAKLKSAQDS
jgi:hypothetical protein